MPDKNGAEQKSKTLRYGDSENSVHLGVIENHFFLFDKTIYTRYAIENYDDIHHLPNWNYIMDSNNKRDKSKCISSYEVIKTLAR